MPDPTVWPVDANGGEPISETFGYLTDIIETYAGREQRICLRSVPLERYEFGILGISARESALAAGIVFDSQDDVVAVPLWHYASKLTGTLSPGGSLISITDAQDIPYRAGGLAIVWIDPFTWELFDVSGTSGSGVATSDVSVGTWPAGSYVFPARRARLSDKASLRWETTRVLSGRLEWTMEQSGIGTIIGSSAPATTFKGVEVLEVEPSRDDGIEDRFERKIFILDTGTGTRSADAVDPAPSALRTVSWVTFSRSEARALREFMDRRRGRQIPFWAPAWEEDLALAADAAPGSSSITILAAGYTARLFPAGKWRRYIAIRTPDGPARYREIISSVDNGNGTETLILDDAVPEAMLAASTLIAFLRYSRLEDDLVRLEWTGGFASAKIAIRNLPGETPN